MVGDRLPPPLNGGDIELRGERLPSLFLKTSTVESEACFKPAGHGDELLGGRSGL